jgi:Dolichyl-phosphate-mannose-protein mannosyltransferase
LASGGRVEMRVGGLSGRGVAVGGTRTESVAARWLLWLVVAGAGVAGVVVRVWVYRSSLGVPTSDEAVVGLMVRHLLHGQFATFYWGQAYGGSQEVLLTAPLFWVAGASWLSLRIVPIVLSGVAALLVWRVGRRMIGEPGAIGAAALIWVWPPWMVWAVTHQLGFYASDVVYGALLLLLGLRVVERPDGIRIGLFGLVLGLAFWQTSQIVPVAVGVIVWTVWQQPRCLRLVWVAVGLALIGALPWLVWNARHGWASLQIPAGVSSTYAGRLRGFLSPVLPMILGLRIRTTEARLLPEVLTVGLYALLVGLFVYGAYRTRHRASSLLFVVMIVFPFVWALSGRTALDTDPRYVVVLVPVITLLIAHVMSTPFRAGMTIAVALVVTVAVLQRMEGPPLLPAAPRNITPLLVLLDKLKIDRVYAPYWAAYVIDFDSQERIIAVENGFDAVTFRAAQAQLPAGANVRYLPYQREVAAARHGFVFFRQDLTSVPIVSQLDRHGYRTHPAGLFIVYTPPPARQPAR